MSQPYGANEEQVNSIPGAEYVSAIAEIWTRSFAEYAATYARTWDQVQSGKFGLADLAKGMTKAWQLQYRTAQELMTIPFRQDVAQWRFFYFDKSVPNALVEQVPLSKQQDATAIIKATPLHIMGPGTTSIVDSFDASWGDGRRSIEIRFDPDKLKTNPAGEYLGFIYNGAAAVGPPLMIILLRIV